MAISLWGNVPPVMQVKTLLRRYQELTTLQAQINIQLTDLAIEKQLLLQEQRQWLRMLLSRFNQL
jgi:hypothetical protein